MSAQQDGGPAFPAERIEAARHVYGGPHVMTRAQYAGMSLRDYFAALAMHAELNTAGAFDGPAVALVEAAEKAGRTPVEQIAFNAYKVADAMLVERETGGEQ